MGSKRKAVIEELRNKSNKGHKVGKGNTISDPHPEALSLEDKQFLVLDEAIDSYGQTNQMDMAVEECAELIKAINKMKRINGEGYIIYPQPFHSAEYCKTYFDLCSEVADVKIMVAQLEIMLSKEAINISYERKIDRLKDRLRKFRDKYVTNIIVKDSKKSKK